jgi:hypothetical protein
VLDLKTKRIQYVRFQVLKVANMKMIVVLDIEPCRLVEVDDVSEDDDHRDDEGSTHLCNVVLLQRDYTALYSRRLSLSACPLLLTFDVKRRS